MQYPWKHYGCELRRPRLRFAVIVWKPLSARQQLKRFFGVIFPARLGLETMALRGPSRDDVLEMQQSLVMKMSFDEL